jgi:prepilin-type N-terminal cleavage/methylation domain-containing protein
MSITIFFKPIKQYQSGFSLIEVAIVLLIVGLLLGGLMTPLATQYENSKRKDTQKSLEAISEALYGFAVSNGRLPCPDTNNDGQENQLAGACAAAFGTLPWVTLNTGNRDAWGRAFIYRVTLTFADSTDGTGCGAATPGVSMSLCSSGDIQVLAAAGGSVIAANLPAMVVSKAGNGAAVGVNEAENSDNDAVFVSKDYSTQAGNPFDDLVEWINPAILNNRLVKAGRLP